jgi:hypothetical protein
MPAQTHEREIHSLDACAERDLRPGRQLAFF